MEIKVLGPGCTNCKHIYREAEKAIALSGQPAQLSKVETVEEIVSYGVMRTPALVVDGRVVTQGKIPSAADIAAMIKAATAARG